MGDLLDGIQFKLSFNNGTVGRKQTKVCVCVRVCVCVCVRARMCVCVGV